MTSHTPALALALVAAGAALAGCMQAPQEAAPPEDEGPPVHEWVLIDGAAYECDAFEVVDAPTESCPEYELEEDEGREEAEGAPEFASEDGRVTIEGTTYACDEELAVDFGEVRRCEEYEVEGT